MYRKRILLYEGFTLRVKCQDRQPGLALALYYLNLAEAPILWAYGDYRSGCGVVDILWKPYTPGIL